MTVKELYDKLGDMIKDNLGDEKIIISHPFKKGKGVGAYFEDLTSASFHDGIVDLRASMRTSKNNYVKK
jgi:hypothetical protein